MNTKNYRRSDMGIEVRKCVAGGPEDVGKYALYGKDDRGQEFGLAYPNAEALTNVLMDLVDQVAHSLTEGILDREQLRISAGRARPSDRTDIL
jgi:hypothetical protein